MKGNKIIATLVVLAMVLSTLVVLDQLKIINMELSAGATPGVDDWGLRTQVWTADLTYDPDNAVDIIVDTTGLQARSYYLYFPDYDLTSTTYNLTWRPYLTEGVQEKITVVTPGTNVTLQDIILNCSGVWVLNTTQVGGVISAHTADLWNDSANRWFWVNTTTTDSLAVSPDEVYFGDNTTITLTATTASGSSAATWFNVRRDDAEEPGVFLKKATGTTTFSSDWKSTLQWAGNYSVIAYRDVDPTEPLYGNTGYENQGWNRSFGSDPAVSAGRYYYAYCGPWDPPEYNSTYNNIQVLPGVPETTIPEANQTVYWGFDGEVQIEVKDYNGDNISNLEIFIYNSDDVNVSGNCTIDNDSDVGYFNITNRNAAGATTGGWGRDANGNTVGENGTWYAYIFRDVDGDNGTQGREWADEWNTTVYFTITNAPGVQWKWIDDDAGISTDNNDGVIPEVPAIASQPVDITFQIIGEDHTYYGDAASADAEAPAELGENISITGDALYLPATFDTLPGVSYAAGTWTVPLTPLMAPNGGEITFNVDWEDYGSFTQTLTIGGKSLNGTVVTISPTEFTYGTDTTFTVTVKTAAGLPAYNAQVKLYWVMDGNASSGTLVNNDNGILAYKNGGGSANGEYTFTINATVQMANQSGATVRGTTYKNAYGAVRAPRNISAYVKLYQGTPEYVYGYALTTMNAQSNLKVTMEPNTVMAGQKTSKFWWNTTLIDSTGNTTGYPADTGLKVRIINSTGEDVTATIGNLAITDTDGDANQTATNKYLQVPGTYTVYAYNDTCDSEGQNGTLVIQPVNVACDLSELIWNVDDNVTATFTVTYNGQPINGTLRLDNITDNGTYNGTWYLTNFTPTIGSTAGADSENTSIQITITNGVGTVHNITAENLWPASIARRNITYCFKSKTSGSAWARADGMLPVKIANVAVTPDTVVLNEASDLTITVTGRSLGLDDVWVNIGGAVDAQNGTTTSDGTITFSVVPSKTGKITIAIENRTSDTYVLVTNWKLYIDSPAQANEGESFTVTVKNSTSSGSELPDAYVTFNKETKQTTADGKATFTAPAVGVNGASMTITATLIGYKETSETIQINNVAKLTVVISGEVKAGQAFNVVIADDSGQPVIGATVTFEGKPYMSGAGGVVALTAPTTEGSYPISATFTGFTAASSTVTVVKSTGVPGFELLTLVAAIGVAFLLLRRRRN